MQHFIKKIKNHFHVKNISIAYNFSALVKKWNTSIVFYWGDSGQKHSISLRLKTDPIKIKIKNRSNPFLHVLVLHCRAVYLGGSKRL